MRPAVEDLAYNESHLLVFELVRGSGVSVSCYCVLNSFPPGHLPLSPTTSSFKNSRLSGHSQKCPTS